MILRPVLAGVIAALSVSACTVQAETEGGGTSRDSAQLIECPGSAVEKACVELAGVTAFAPNGLPESNLPLVIVDIGGPGINPMAPASSSAMVMAQIPNVLIPLEPWVSRPPSEVCETALEQFIGTVRSGQRVGDAAKEFDAGCAPELRRENQYARESLRGFVAAATHEWSSDLILVGASFGAQRLLTIDEPARLRLLLSPYVTSTDLERDASQRWGAVRQAVSTDELDSLLGEARSVLPKAVPGRSVPFTSVDLAAAVLGAGYDSTAGRRWLLRDLRQVVNTRTGEAASVRYLDRAADSIEGRFGVNSVYPGIVGYMGNYCAQYKQTGPRAPFLQAGRFLGRLYSGCPKLPRARPVARSLSAATCLVYSPLDPISNGDKYARLSGLDGADVVELSSPTHAGPQVLQSGLDVLQRAISNPDVESCS